MEAILKLKSIEFEVEKFAVEFVLNRCERDSAARNRIESTQGDVCA